MEMTLPGKPCLRHRRLSVGQQSDGSASFQIADDRSITLIAAPSPIVDADHCRWDETRASPPSHDAQQCVVAHRQHEAPRETRRRPPAQDDAETINNVIEARGSAPPWRQQLFVKALRENAPTAQNGVAVKAARQEDNSDGLVRKGKIGQAPLITAMDSRRHDSASRTIACFAHGPNGDDGAAGFIPHAFNDKTARNQTRCLEDVAHGFDSLCENHASWRRNFIKNESEPLFHAK